jgi:hypothetical protein
MRTARWIIATIACCFAALVEGAEPSSAAIVTVADIVAAVRQLSPDLTDDEPLRVLDAGPDRLGAFVVGRPRVTGPARVGADGAVAVTEGLQLDRVSTVLEVLSGAGEFVAGGRLTSPARMAPDDPDASVIGAGSRGKAIIGGSRRRIAQGDMVIIPAGVPHGFAAIESPITYLVIRVDSGRSLPLK